MILSLEQQQLLLKQNKNLRLQLRQANIKIKSLQQQVSHLQERLSHFQNEETTINHDQSLVTSEQVFTQSSRSSQNYDYIYDEQSNIVSEEQSISETNQNMIQKPLKVIFNYNSDGKQPPQALQSKFSQKLEHSGKLPYKNHNLGNQVKSQGAIKVEKQAPKTNKGLFQKMKASKKIFQTFFVTGYSKNLETEIQYFYPDNSNHFQALLALIYSDNSIQSLQSFPSKSPNQLKKLGKFTTKQTFVIPLRKADNEQKQYLVACQVQDYITGYDNKLYSFSRMFCFISVCNFFGAFKKILQQFIDKINSRTNKFFSISPLCSNNLHQQLKQLLQQHLQILWVKTIQQNQYASYALGNQIKVFIDTPSAENSYKTLHDFNSHDIFSLKVSVDYQNKFIRSDFIGFFTIYLLSETKIMLYSYSKSKISQAILHIAQFIKPLEYVNPIIMANIKEDHQEYLNAPMSLLLGIWNQARSKKRQKLQVVAANIRKDCLGGAIQDCSLVVKDGIVINLDTGRIFGGGLIKQKSQLAMELNTAINKICKGFDDKYKLFDKIFRNNFLDGPESKFLRSRLIHCIQNSQLYSFFKQKSNSIYH